MKAKVLFGTALLALTITPALAETTRADIREEQQEAKQNIQEAHDKAEREARENRRGMPDADPYTTRNDILTPEEPEQNYVRGRNNGMNN